jgi:hypothetical protein
MVVAKKLSVPRSAFQFSPFFFLFLFELFSSTTTEKKLFIQEII